MLTWVFLYWLMFFSGLLSFCINRKHLLSVLLSLEFIVICLFGLMFIILGFYGYEIFFSMIFLLMSVCEGCLGLSILVSMIRTHGNDCFQSFSLLW